MATIYRKQIIEGISVPGIIHNSNYYFVDMAVYEDGTVDCWHKSDLTQFRNDIDKGWVIPQVPIGAELSVYGLGDFTVRDAKWLHDKNGFYQYIENIVRKLNPEMENLYHETPRIAEKWKKVHVSWSETPKACKRKGDFGYDLLDGMSEYVFYQNDDKLQITFLTAYEDKTLRIDAKGDIYYSLDEILKMFDTEDLRVSLKNEEWVHIDGLGEVLLAPDEYSNTKLKEKKKEVAEMVAEMANEPTAHDKCIEAYHNYLVEPSDYTREKLREAYEAVPEHQRMFLGDMDGKDSDFVRILYYPNNKREV